MDKTEDYYAERIDVHILITEEDVINHLNTQIGEKKNLQKMENEDPEHNNTQINPI